MEEKLIFKSYARLLLRDLQDVKEALHSKDYSKAEKLINDLIKDTKEDAD